MSLWIYLLIAMLLIAACSKEEQGEKPESLPTKSDGVNEEVEEEGALTYMAPFTGNMTVEENSLRPVLATINNHPLARPQSGISEADIVYEFLAEGNVTRLLAIFQSELPDEIGPIRSARDYFINVAKGLDAFYVAHGYSPDAQALLQSNYVDHVNGMQHDGTLFERLVDRKAPHNSYISNENILLAAENLNASMEINKMPPFSFHESIESVKIGEAGETAETTVIRHGSHPNFTSTYAYNKVQGTYDRTVNEVPTVDKANEEPVELANILVFEASYRTIDAEGRRTVDLESGGKGILFHAGIVKEIEWENIDGILTPIEDGLPAKLVPGKTWIHIIPSSPGIESTVSYTP